MPAASTHILFAKEFYYSLEHKKRNAIQDMPMFLVGSQGPDILFFSHMSVMPGSLHKYGNLMHESKVWETIEFFDTYSRNDLQLQSYMIGYLTHYALDRYVHPLVISEAESENKLSALPVGPTHVRMESEIDTWILHQAKKTGEEENLWKYFNIGTKRREKLASMYSAMFKSVYNLDISASRISHALLELNVWTAFMRPRHITRNVMFGPQYFISSPIKAKNMVLHGDQATAIINLEHNSYPLYFDNERMINDSFPELYDKAMRMSYQLLKYHDEDDFIFNFMGEPAS